MFQRGDKVVRVVPNFFGSSKYGVVGEVYTVTTQVGSSLYLHGLSAGCVADAFVLAKGKVTKKPKRVSFVSFTDTHI